jgi:hypothetical protein
LKNLPASCPKAVKHRSSIEVWGFNLLGGSRPWVKEVYEIFERHGVGIVGGKKQVCLPLRS